MKCPSCGLVSPDAAPRCSCGYRLVARRFYSSYDRMRIWDFFLNSWRTFGKNWTAFLLLVLIPTLAPSALASAIRLGSAAGSLFTLSILSTMAGIVSGAIWIISTMAITMAAHKTSEGQVISAWESYELSASHFWPYLWTATLYFLVVGGGLLLMIIPGIVWAFHYVFAPSAVLIEGVSGRPALWLSKSLTKGRVVRILGIEVGFGVLFLVAFHLPLRLLVSMVEGSPDDTFIGPPGPRPEWAGAIELFGQLISAALFVIFNVLLYKSLRMMDLEARGKDGNLRNGVSAI